MTDLAKLLAALDERGTHSAGAELDTMRDAARLLREMAREEVRLRPRRS